MHRLERVDVKSLINNIDLVKENEVKIKQLRDIINRSQISYINWNIISLYSFNSKFFETSYEILTELSYYRRLYSYASK